MALPVLVNIAGAYACWTLDQPRINEVTEEVIPKMPLTLYVLCALLWWPMLPNLPLIFSGLRLWRKPVTFLSMAGGGIGIVCFGLWVFYMAIVAYFYGVYSPSEESTISTLLFFVLPCAPPVAVLTILLCMTATTLRHLAGTLTVFLFAALGLAALALPALIH